MLASYAEAFIAPRMSTKSSSLQMLDAAPYEDIIPFLSEHVQPSDQLVSDLGLRGASRGWEVLHTVRVDQAYIQIHD